MRRLDLLPSAPFYPTASELHRAAECVAPWALGLPEAEEAPGEWAEFGRRCHKGVEMLALGQGWIETLAAALPDGGDDRVEQVLHHCDLAIDADIEAAKPFRPSVFMVEQGVAWRPGFPDDEAKLVQREPGERLRGWFSGTVDLAYVRADGVLVVVDWKFGPREHINGEPAQDSCQGFFLALALCTALEIRGSSAGVVVARFERRMVREDGIEVDGHNITQGELDAWAKTLAGLARRIDSAVEAAPKLSAACGKCKAKQGCPAWDAMEQAIVVAAMDMAEGALISPPEGPVDVRVLHFAIEEAEHLATEWKKWRDAYVLVNGPVPLGMGLQLEAEPQSKRQVLDTSEAMDLIESVAGKSAIVVQRSATCDSIKKAARDTAGDGITSTADRNKAKAKAEADVFARLIEGGAIREQGKTYAVRVVRAGEEE